MQLLVMYFATTDGRERVFTRYPKSEPDQQLLPAQLGWGLPEHTRPRISGSHASGSSALDEIAAPDRSDFMTWS